LASAFTFLLINRDKSSSSESWLFSQSAKSARFVDSGGGTYTLTLNDVDPHTVAFTDRPDRDASILGVEGLISQWPVDFADSPPNAVTVGHSLYGSGVEDSVVVELVNPVLDGTTLTFTTRLLGTEEFSSAARSIANTVYSTPPASMGAVTVFIDNANGSSSGKKTICIDPAKGCDYLPPFSLTGLP
jgi:hypothetical protein